MEGYAATLVNHSVTGAVPPGGSASIVLRHSHPELLRPDWLERNVV
jgi:hypothetical protein